MALRGTNDSSLDILIQAYLSAGLVASRALQIAPRSPLGLARIRVPFSHAEASDGGQHMSGSFKPWFEREFPGGYPVDLFANLYARLHGSPVRVRSLVEGLEPGQLVRSLGGSWSMQRNLGHLIDLEQLWLARVDDFLAGRAELTPADVENRTTHDADHDRSSIGDLLDQFTQVRGLFLSRIVDLEPQQLGLTSRHPRLGHPMRMIDSFLFVAEHDDHHIARLIELRGLVVSQP